MTVGATSQAPVHDPSAADDASASLCEPASLEEPLDDPLEDPLDPLDEPLDEPLDPLDDPLDPLDEPVASFDASLPESSPDAAGPPLLLLHPAANRRPIVATVRFMAKLPYLGFDAYRSAGAHTRASPRRRGHTGEPRIGFQDRHLFENAVRKT